ncbi:MAG: hypothetical protein KDD65_15450 [Bacteroidetes bacterium]|nr:hypothetical protein [Bacteroidota bacterium]
MVIVEYRPNKEEIIDFIDQSIASLSEAGIPAHSILLGPASYSVLQEALARALHRDEGTFQTYNYLPLVVDPIREDRICVLPSPAECAAGVQFVTEGPG